MVTPRHEMRNHQKVSSIPNDGWKPKLAKWMTNLQNCKRIVCAAAVVIILITILGYFGVHRPESTAHRRLVVPGETGETPAEKGRPWPAEDSSSAAPPSTFTQGLRVRPAGGAAGFYEIREATKRPLGLD